MDDFSQKMLERAKLRRQKLDSHMSNAGITRRAMPLQENSSLNIDKTVSQPSPASSKINEASNISSTGKSKLQQLGNLYSNCETLSSPIHRAEDKILEEVPKSLSNKCRLKSLNEHAATIREWEDDLSHPDLKKKTETKPSVTKFTKTETKLTESTVSTTITMTTINKNKGNEQSRKTTATIVSAAQGTSPDTVKSSETDNSTRKKKADHKEEVEAAEKVPRLTGVRSNSNIIVGAPTSKQTQWDRAIKQTLESQESLKNNDSKITYDDRRAEKNDSPGKSPRSSGTYRKINSGLPPKSGSPYKKSQAPAPPTGTYKKSKAPAPPVSMVESRVKCPSPQRASVKAPSPQRTSIKAPSPQRTSIKAPSPQRGLIKAPTPSKSPKMGVSALDKESSVLKRAAMFEAKHQSPAKSKDPAELSLSERKALFEKNKGEILLPKVAFATPLPAKLRQSPSKIRTSPMKIPKHVAPKVTKDACINHLKEKFEQDLVEKTNINMSKLEREKELESLKNRWNVNKGVADIPALPIKTGYAEETKGPAPPPPPMPVLSPSPVKNVVQEYKDSPEALKAVQGVKKIILSPTRKGKLYPSLSDIEAEESESSDSDSLNQSKHSEIYLNMSFGEILEASKNNPMTPPKKTQESVVLNEMDELLDAALGDVSSSDDDDDGATPPKLSRNAESSSSFEFTNGTPRKPASTPLVHTVSFYRKQQNCLSTPNNTPMKVIKRNEVVDHGEDTPVDEATAVKHKIEKLMIEIAKQQTVISQASNLLSVCMANIEFSGSEEQVEGERLLLHAGHKRQACLYEVERLKVEGSVRPRSSNTEQLKEQGDLVISNITIPLKRDALRAMAADESMQYFVCLIKSDERVVATPVVSATRQNLQGTILAVPGEFRLEKLYSDFKVTLEIYHMVLSRELLPHHIKYHLPGKKDKGLLTPIKNKKTQSRLVMPNMQSPAGPSAVRTTNFAMCGYVVFSLRELKRNQWTLNKVPYTSPLEGSMGMQIASSLQLDDEFRGFLAMFDDVSGLGAWHRRWCLLSAHTLSYWKYPDDENKKVPLGSLDLRTVVTDTVGLVSRDICARLNTFLMETTRPREPQDAESLVLVLDGDVARIRHLLSADTKEERLEWCARLNKALALIRAWNCQV